jgi:hypothetical protein
MGSWVHGFMGSWFMVHGFMVHGAWCHSGCSWARLLPFQWGMKEKENLREEREDPEAQSDRRGPNAPRPGMQPEEFVDDDSGNRFGPTPPPAEPDPKGRKESS